MKIGIIGLGLIGGSLAKSIKRKDKMINIIAFDSDIEQLKVAYKDKNINAYYDKVDESFFDCDIIFMCTPVNITIKIVNEIKDFIKSDCVITDVSSTKSEIMNSFNDINFLGGHPMTGSEKSGYLNASDILFENAYYVVTPYENSKEEHKNLLRNIIELIGAIYIEMSPKEHDESVSIISHIPHILASSLVNFVKAKDNEKEILKTLCAGGFKDITRIASSNGKLWNSIIKSNNKYVLKNFKAYIDEQIRIYNIIEAGEDKELINYIDEGKKYRDGFKNTLSFNKSYDISVDVPDEPNVIGIIATILGKRNINIKNIGINHNREDCVFALTISFYDKIAMDNAVNILIEQNYSVIIMK